MNRQVNVNIPMDRDLKELADILFDRMGLDMTIAVNAFVKQCLREESIPFQIKPYDDYRTKIALSLRQADEGKLIEFTLDELESFESMETGSALEFIRVRLSESGL